MRHRISPMCTLSLNGYGDKGGFACNTSANTLAPKMRSGHITHPFPQLIACPLAAVEPCRNSFVTKCATQTLAHNIPQTSRQCLLRVPARLRLCVSVRQRTCVCARACVRCGHRTQDPLVDEWAANRHAPVTVRNTRAAARWAAARGHAQGLGTRAAGCSMHLMRALQCMAWDISGARAICGA